MNTETTKYSETLEFILKSLVSKPDKIKISSKVKEGREIIGIVVDQDDMGLVIGRNGIMANAIKTVISSIAKISDKKVQIEILEPSKD